MATIKYRIRGKKNPANILVRLIDGRKCDIEASTNLMINVEDWNQEKQKPKNTRGSENKNLEMLLLELKANLLAHYNSTLGLKNKNWLENFLNPSENKIPSSLSDYFDFYLTEKKNIIKQSSYKTFEKAKNRLIEFQKDTKQIYFIEEVDIVFKTKYEKWCKSKGYNENTISKYLGFIKTICLHAQKNGKKLAKSFDEIKKNERKTQFIYLTLEELNKIKETNFNDEKLSIAKDWLLISAFTAQRISDFMRFSAEMIKEYDGQKVIEFTQEKTGKTIALPLHKEVIEVLDKRKGEFPPRQLDQKYNKYIKTVCREAGIIDQVEGGRSEVTDKGIRKVFGKFEKCELVSSHIGRRSFATNFYGKIPTPLLMVATGHATEKMFLSYIGKSDKDKALELAKWF
ncbi:hypothetical protein BWK60_12460 [Flavobacterium covae]|uniref:site-specific integrase n=1 Tax=Flavobacterium covae TaxID=2906076 RepID=UPI000B4D7D56|nr:site-specific integrase [Flavobacterium covae]OWP85752.1 hypothetical protein BWK60_12460 [Flavobacterium covae]